MNKTMKINYICSFLAGAVLSLLLMFFIKPSFFISDNDVNEKNNVKQELKNLDLTQSNARLTGNEKTNKSCDDACVLGVIERLKTRQNLKNEYGPSMQDFEALATADYLKDKSELLTEIEASLAATLSQSERDSFVTVFNYLPVDQVVEVSKRLIASGFNKAEIDGLNMLYGASKKGAEIKQAVESVIKEGKDFRVVVEAIKILHKTHPNEFEGVAAERLNATLADSTASERDQARALITKVQLFTANDSIKTDIINGLNSKSSRIQAKGIQALDYVLAEKYDARDASFDWAVDSNLKETIAAIMNDEDAAARNRRESMNLLIRYF